MLGYGVAAGWNYENEGYHFYHADEQLSTAYITGAEGRTENRYQYDAFGVVRECQEKIQNRILYTGQQYDQITEQYYLRARYYNPAVGRFLQEDVYRGDGLNLYAYCGNNPVIYYDPSGYSDKFLPNGSRENWGTEHGRNNPPHNNSIEVELDWASSVGATDIMKAKRQVDAAGNDVFYIDSVTGKKRRIFPDAGYTIDGVRFNTNYVSNNRSKSGMEREMEAFKHMAEADPDAVNTLVILYDDPLKPKTEEIEEEKCK